MNPFDRAWRYRKRLIDEIIAIYDVSLDTAEDIVQDAYLRAVGKARISYRVLLVCARQRAIDTLGKRHPWSIGGSDDIDALSAGRSPLARLEARSELAVVLAPLSAADREILHRRFVRGDCCAEVGAARICTAMRHARRKKRH